ncbi:hypothetical protein MRX96_037718 [Rhipicephalus microplus]
MAHRNPATAPPQMRVGRKGLKLVPRGGGEEGKVRMPTGGGALLDLYDISQAKGGATLSAPVGPDSDREHRGHALAAHRCHAHALHLPPARAGKPADFAAR